VPDKPAPRPEVRITTVESEGTGRLFVSGSAAAGATLRLYLNDSFVAPGGTGPDGHLAFTIERGVRPGDYQVRLDDVDPVNGAVRSRAEVPFSVPVPNVVASAGAASAGSGAAAPAPPNPAAAAPRPMPRRSSVARAFPPAPTEGSTGGRPIAPDPGPAEPRPEAQDSALPPGPAFASRQDSLGAVVVPEVNTAIVSRGDNLWRISKRTYGAGMRYTVIYGANLPQIRNPGLIYPGQVFVLPPREAQAEH
jgi:nucleoid-associated protein YgaU